MKTIRGLLASAAMVLASPTQASLIGDTVTCSFSSALTCSTPTAVVTPGIEFTLDAPSPFFSVDIGASSIQIRAIGNNNAAVFAANSFVLTLGSLDDPAGNIVGITNFATANTTNISAADVAVTAHSVAFTFDNSTWAGLAATSGVGTASFDLVIGPLAVAEPMSLALVGLGLTAFGLSRRRKQV